VQVVKYHVDPEQPAGSRCALQHARRYPHTRTRAHTRAHARARTHIRAHAYAHTRARTLCRYVFLLLEQPGPRSTAHDDPLYRWGCDFSARDFAKRHASVVVMGNCCQTKSRDSVDGVRPTTPSRDGLRVGAAAATPSKLSFQGDVLRVPVKSQ
jgi:hypothetical protein